MALLKARFTWIFFRVLQKKSIVMLLIVGILNNFTTKEIRDIIEEQPEFQPWKVATLRHKQSSKQRMWIRCRVL